MPCQLVALHRHSPSPVTAIAPLRVAMPAMPLVPRPRPLICGCPSAVPSAQERGCLSLGIPALEGYHAPHFSLWKWRPDRCRVAVGSGRFAKLDSRHARMADHVKCPRCSRGAESSLSWYLRTYVPTHRFSFDASVPQLAPASVPCA
jgi:hypothetical protein